MEETTTVTGTEAATPDVTVESSETPLEASEVAQSTEDTGEAVEASGEATEGITNDFLENFDLDEFLKAEFSADDIMSQTHKGLPNYEEILKHLPENGRKLIANLRAMTTRKTQDLADNRKSLEAEREALMAEKKALYSGQFAEKVKTMSQEPETPHDVFSDDGMKAQIQMEAAKLMAEMISPMQEEMVVERRKMALENFKRENPDLVDPEIRMGCAKLLQSRPELKLEDAYYITKAKLGQSKLASLESEKRLSTERKKMAWSNVSAGSNIGKTSVPQFKDAWQAYQWHRDNK